MASLAQPIEPTQRIDTIRAGLPAAAARGFLAGLDLPLGALMQGLAIAPATFNRKVARGESLSPAESERILGLSALVDKVQTMVEESGDPTGFDAAAWLSSWLAEPVPALGWQRPLDLLDTMAGQQLVHDTLDRMQSGAYA
jgi:putative toxin-antitoxin system antitoxin component (TIGR02293 family)